MHTGDPYMTGEEVEEEQCCPARCGGYCAAPVVEEPTVIAGEQPEQAPLTEQERAELVGYGLIFAQLLQSERFRTFFQVNYDLVKVVDDGEKTVTMHVVEVPPQLVPERMQRMLAEAQKDAPMVEVVGAEALKDLKG